MWLLRRLRERRPFLAPEEGATACTRIVLAITLIVVGPLLSASCRSVGQVGVHPGGDAGDPSYGDDVGGDPFLLGDDAGGDGDAVAGGDASEPPPACTHWASPAGGGDGSSETSPFRINDFWGVASGGDTLCLLDGTYRGPHSMIHPALGLSGSEGSPITVVAWHDGEVDIDGEGQRGPVFLDDNDWFVLAGFNAHSASLGTADVESSVSRLYGCDHVTVRRVVGWDANDCNCSIFVTDYSTHIVYEDVAGFGVARKIVGAGHRSDSNFDSALANNRIRRAFARLEHNTWGGQVAMTVGYNTNGNIIENSIVTLDGYFVNEAGVGSSNNHGFHDDRQWDEHNQILGSIAYRTPDESVEGADTLTLLNADSNYMKVRDVLVAVEDPESSYGTLLKSLGRLNAYRYEDYDARSLTFYGGPGTLIGPTSGAVISHIIAMNATWNEEFATTDSVPATGIFTPIASWGAADYVMAYGNHRDWNVQPAHHAVEDPDLVGLCGNLLQYGCSSRPTVDGEAVGAQIQCRYEDGVLTDKPLWPWPMNERIRVATCMYDHALSKAECEGRTDLGVDVTKTVFELGGGHVPDFATINPIVCPGG